MIRVVLAAAAVAAIGVTAVLAQQADVIAERKAVMKTNGEQARLGNAIVKGEAPFDAAKVQAIFVTFQDTAKKGPGLFPPTSKTGGDTAALPKIWEDKADFDAKFAKLGQDATAAAAASKDLDSFKAAFPGVLRDCGACHETYRAKRS